MYGTLFVVQNKNMWNRELLILGWNSLNLKHKCKAKQLESDLSSHELGKNNCLSKMRPIGSNLEIILSEPSLPSNLNVYCTKPTNLWK